MTKRIISILIAIVMLCSGTALAQGRTPDEYTVEELMEKYTSDMISSEKVHLYDYMAGIAQDDETEVLMQRNAVTAVLTLGLMENTEDGFNENGAVPYKDFAKIISKLLVGYGMFDEQYDAYPDNQYTKQREAVNYLVEALGYDAWEPRYPGENGRILIAEKIDLLSGISYVGEKNITRGEFARLLYNALATDVMEQTTFGEISNFEIRKGKTLAKKWFDVDFVWGVVTAQRGIDLYSGLEKKQNILSIDRVDYEIKTKISEDLLGHQVFAVAKVEESGYYELLGICKDDEDDTIQIDLRDVLGVSNGRLLYVDSQGEEDYIKISDINHIVENGVTLATQTFTNSMLDHSGYLRLCKSAINSRHNLAVFITYDCYLVEKVSVFNEKIYLAHGAKHNGATYISYEDKALHIIADGAEADISAITPGKVISVIENAAGTEIQLIVSSKQVDGVVTEVLGNEISIDGDKYLLGDCYEEFRQTDSTLPKISVHTTGIFYIDFMGNIVSVDTDGSDYSWAYLRQIGKQGAGFKETPILRVFTKDNKWFTYELAEKLTLDGESGITKSDAYEILKSDEGTVCDALIRLKLDAEGKVKALDTCIVGMYEAGDTNAVRKETTWSNTTNWTVTSPKSKATLTGSVYSYTNNSEMFIVPVDPEDEENYIFTSSIALAEQTRYLLELYNADEFYVASMLIQRNDAGTAFAGTTYRFVISEILKGIDSKGEECYIITGIDNQPQTRWAERKYTISAKLNEQVERELKPGLIIRTVNNGHEVSAFKLDYDTANYMTDKKVTPGDTSAFGVGEVLAVDPVRQYIKLRTTEGTDAYEVVGYIRNVGLYDRSEEKAYNVSINEVQPGDRIYMSYSYGWSGVLIIRE